ncbi:MAG: hypothetical protein SFW08_11290 [Gemmatimonadaceae bacterium]|nr:hypothetical protein [Gemmatimonadaceae bacterium]
MSHATRARGLAVGLLAAGVAGCALDVLVSGNPVRASAFPIAVTGDSVLVAGTAVTLRSSLPPSASSGVSRLRWRSSDTSIVAIDSLTGRTDPRRAGRCTVTVQFEAPDIDGVAQAAWPLRVRYAALRIQAPDSLTSVGDSLPIGVDALAEDGRVLQPVPASVTAVDTTIVTVTGGPARRVIARRNGSTSLTATFDAVSVSRPVRVRQVAARITLADTTLLIGTGADTAGSVQRITDRRGNTMTAPVSWVSADTTIATVDSTGRIVSRAAGEVLVRARADTAQRAIRVRVVTPGPATRLVAVQEPASSATAGVALAPLVVRAVDSLGVWTSTYTGQVVVSLADGPAGASLLGTVSVAMSAGRATFSTLRLTRTGSYRLQVAAGTIGRDTTQSFSIVPAPPARLTVVTAPSGGYVGLPLAPLTLSVLDSVGNIVPNEPVTVTLALTGGGAGAQLLGTFPRATIDGVVTFDDLQVSALGTANRITASAAGVLSTQTAAFNVTGQATQMAFVQQPATVTAGREFASPIVVQVRDAAGTIVTAAQTSVTLRLQTPPPTSFVGAGVGGTLTAEAVNGVATFPAVRVRLGGTNQRLVAEASDATISSATSNTFTVTPAPGARLAFNPEPPASYTASTSANIGGSTNPGVEALDSLGNRATSFTEAVTVTLIDGTAGAVLSGTLTRPSVAGITNPVFNDLRMTTAGVGYRLVATSIGVAPDTSVAFTVLPTTASQLVFRAQPTNVAVNAAMAPALIVEARDQFGNLVTSRSGTVTMAIVSGTGTTGAALGGATASMTNGVAVFDALTVSLAGTGYRVRASLATTTLVTANSNPFTVTP